MNLKSKHKPSIHNIIFVVLVISILMFTVFSYMNREAVSTQSLHTKAQLTPHEFISLFDSTHADQAQQYIDEAIEIQGVLEKVTFRNNRYTLFINSDEEGRFIMCEMQNDQIEVLKNIKKDEIVTVKGIFKGVLLDAILLNCIVIN